eukprot:3076900-Rhodomonas_salina.4
MIVGASVNEYKNAQESSAICLRARYAMPATDLVWVLLPEGELQSVSRTGRQVKSAISLRARSAMPGTDMAYAAAQRNVKEVAKGRIFPITLGVAAPCPRMLLPGIGIKAAQPQHLVSYTLSCYAVSSTNITHNTTHGTDGQYRSGCAGTGGEYEDSTKGAEPELPHRARAVLGREERLRLLLAQQGVGAVVRPGAPLRAQRCAPSHRCAPSRTPLLRLFAPLCPFALAIAPLR